MRRLLIFFVILSGLGCASKDGKKVCDNITMREGELELNRNEEVLVCGSSKGQEGWRDVPLPQAQYQLGVILQREGYLKPRFERDRDQLYVWTGPREETKSFTVNGADDVVDESRKRKIVGEPLTPAKLDEATRWATMELRSHGYACPQVDIKAQAWDGAMIMDINPGAKQRIGDVTREGLGSLDQEAVARYEAFEPGDLYDVRKTELTANRMMADGLFQSAYFTQTCAGDKVNLQLRASLGPPHLLRFGVGASTEEFPFADVTYRNTKLDDRASSFTLVLHTSPKEQSLTLTSELYHLPFSRRMFWGPRARLERESESVVEDLKAKAGADIGRKWDSRDHRIIGRVGPSLNYVNTVRGVGPDDVSYVSWEGALSVQSHQYELFYRDQSAGWQSAFEYRGQRKGIGSPINVDRYGLTATHLWNIGGYSPPLLVLGTRAQGIAVNANPQALSRSRNVLPSDYRIFYGGDSNLRGFGRKSVHNEGLGFLTAAYLGFELRLVEQLPYKLQPFLLFDVAKLGNYRFTLDEPIFTSQGVGLRWASPFGTLRGSAARGRILQETPASQSYPEEWVYYVNFGQEF